MIMSGQWKSYRSTRAAFMQYNSSIDAVQANYLIDADSMLLVQYKCSIEWQHNVITIAVFQDSRFKKGLFD